VSLEHVLRVGHGKERAAKGGYSTYTSTQTHSLSRSLPGASAGQVARHTSREKQRELHTSRESFTPSPAEKKKMQSGG
jgi:hypothetical protein